MNKNSIQSNREPIGRNNENGLKEPEGGKDLIPPRLRNRFGQAKDKEKQYLREQRDR